MAASTCFEYLFTASCQPPTVPTEEPEPCGSVVTLNFPTTFDCFGSAPSEYAYGQFRMNAALPARKAVCASPSWYDVTPRGVIFPIPARNESSTAAALGLLIVTLPLSMKWPAPEEASHSRESQVRPSYEFPWKTKPEKLGLSCFSPSWIFFAIANSCFHVCGGPA